MDIKDTPLVIGDNISTKGIKTRANSKMLENYIPVFNATVVERLLEKGGTILEKGSIREFGVGKAKEPYGTAKVVANGERIIGIASDTEGEIIKGASKYKVYGLKPSYGLISRYGLIGSTSSIDTMGILGNNIEDLALTLSIVAGKDPKDSTSLDIENIDYTSLDIDKESIKIGIIEDDFKDSEKIKKKLEEIGLSIERVSLSSLEYAIEAYEIISSGEFASNMGRFDGISYGYRTENFNNIDELYKNSRSESLGEEVKKKILFGNFVISSENYKEYFEKAQRIRTMIKEELDNIFKEYDFLLLPTSTKYTVASNLAGFPALALPYKEEGIQLIGPSLSEKELLSLGSIYENQVLKENIIDGDK